MGAVETRREASGRPLTIRDLLSRFSPVRCAARRPDWLAGSLLPSVRKSMASFYCVCAFVPSSPGERGDGSGSFCVRRTDGDSFLSGERDDRRPVRYVLTPTPGQGADGGTVQFWFPWPFGTGTGTSARTAWAIPALFFLFGMCVLSVNNFRGRSVLSKKKEKNFSGRSRTSVLSLSFSVSFSIASSI